MPELTLGFSSCPNDTFIFDAMIHGKVDCEGLSFKVVMDDVEALNDMATLNQLNVTKLSYHAYTYVSKNYILLHSGSALGRGCGPLVIAKKHLSDVELNDCMLAIPGKMTTAHFLFNLFYPKVDKKRFMRFDGIETAILNNEVCAGVIIHENRFTYREKGLVCIKDLGAAWEKQTNLPIPLGGIVVQRALSPEIRSSVQRCIRRSIDYAFAHPTASMDYVKAHAQEMDETVVQQHINLYVNEFSRDLGSEGIEAINRMFKKAEELSIIEEVERPYLI